VLPKSGASESLLSFLVVSKLEDRQPLYHLEKQLKERYGIDCSRQTMARWLIDLIQPLRPLANLLKDPVIEYGVSSCDATTLQVLDEPGRPAETKSYVYCMRGGPPGQEVVLYAYNDRLHKQFVADWYQDYRGFLHVDGDNFFDLIGSLSGVELVNCNAHARRKFEPIAKATKGSGLAKEALKFYKALYKIEKKAKELGLEYSGRYALRQKESKPILEEFKKWLDRHMCLVLPQSPLGKAIQYCLNRWDGLIRYCEDGRLEIDNNLTEQEIKPLVIARKNFLFAHSVDGAHALCLHLSLIRTAKQHGLDPYRYYVEVLKNIPYCKSVEDYEKLLPWNVKKNFKKSH
jgi:transposase